MHVHPADHKEQCESEEHEKLYSEIDDRGHGCRDRHRQTRKIDLPEHRRIVHKRVRCADQTCGKVRPRDIARHIEQKLRQPVRRQACDPTEHERLHDRRKQRLNDVPERAEDRLLIPRLQIALHKQSDQVPVFPDLFQIQLEQLLLRHDDRCPLFAHPITPAPILGGAQRFLLVYTA